MKKIYILLFISFIFVSNSFSQLTFAYDWGDKQCARTDYFFDPSENVVGSDSLVWHWGEVVQTTSSYLLTNFETSHRFNGAGVFNVYYELYEGETILQSEILIITVYDKPSINIEYDNPGISCAPKDSVKIVYSSTNAIEHPATQFIINWGDASSQI